MAPPAVSSTPDVDFTNEKVELEYTPSAPTPTAPPVKRITLPRMSNRFNQFFTAAPKRPRPSDAPPQRPSTSSGAQSAPNSPSASSVSLPTICLSTATGENSKPEDQQQPRMLFTPPSREDMERVARTNAQFGPLLSKEHLYTSRFTAGEFPDPIEDSPPYYFLLTTYISYLVLIIFGHVRDFFGKRFRQRNYRHLRANNGYAPLNSDFDNFYVRRLKARIDDCFARPTTGVPGRMVNLLDRVSDDYNASFRLLGTTTETLNLSSYNYLGFAQSEGPCADAVEAVIRKNGITTASTRADAGTSELHVEVEELIADFVGKPAAMVFSMGFATNAAAFPALVGKGSLIISDELNHSSIRFGARLSGAVVMSFKHNNMRELEKLLRRVISEGQPRTRRPWKKILVAVEGLYSMEGTMCNLPGLVALRRKYHFYLFVDEAHSIGALGPRGRGVCDYFNIDTRHIDVLMGTLTKSFGANGGYVAADAHIIAKLRATNTAMLFAEAPSPPVLAQIAASLRIIRGDVGGGEGEERLQRLAFNSRYLRLGLKRLGFIVYGHDDSPIIPLLLYHPAKMPAFSHEMLARRISVVVVGYPATPLISSRARFCVSAAHNKEDLDRVLRACDVVGDRLQLKFSSGVAGGLRDGEELGAAAPPRWDIAEVVDRGVADVKGILR